HGRWYLLCWSHRAEATRAYRIDRVTEVEVLTDTFRPPTDLDPVADLETHLAIGWEYEVEVVIDGGFDRVARCIPRTVGRLEAIDADTTRLVGSTSNPWWYAEQLARIPASYRIVTGPEVQEAARELGERLLAAADSATGRD
ncbi:MAG TPA: WYL domain-containing protein, partial [Nocardioidaceae bacterium]|nr:WYL domain-containing protein [Nocardioidaceae bacterium]